MSARFLNRAYGDNRSINNICFQFPIRSRDYVISYGDYLTMTIGAGRGEYHPPRDDLSDDVRSEHRARALKRARRKFINLCLANDFRYMVTLTLDPKHPKFHLLNDPYRIKQTFKDIYRNKKMTFGYLGVCELQKNNNCHLHILTTKEIRCDLVKNDFGYLQFTPWVKYGFTNIRKILQKDYEKQTSYLTKYLFKEKDSKRYNYFRSQGLMLPSIVYNIELSEFAIDSKFKTEYGITVYNYKRKV